MISKDEVARIAQLAKLRLETEELERMTGDLSRILEFVGQIGEAGEEGAGDGSGRAEGATPLRNDVPASSLDAGPITANAPAFAHGHFLVPKVLGGEQ